MEAKLGFRISQNTATTTTPPIPLVRDWVREYNQTPTKPLLDLSQGVLGIPPPPEFFAALSRVSADPTTTNYGSISGSIPLREVLAGEMKVVYGEETDVTAEDISLTTGCNMAFTATIMALADPGDEVILPVPWYFNHQMTLTMLGVKPVPLPTYPEDGFVPSLEKCANLITPKIKAIALVTPNNPTGAIYSPSVLASFARLASEKGVALIIDETYRDFITTGPPHSLFSTPSSSSNSELSSDWSWRSTIIHLFSFSKSYCIPGHRLGAIVSSPSLQTHIRTALDCMQICPPQAVQLALAPILSSLRPFVRASASALAARHKLFKEVLPRPWSIVAQSGCFAFVRHPWKGVGSREVAKMLTTELGVMTLPGVFFGFPLAEDGKTVEEATEMDRYIRFSVGNVSDEAIREVCGRLEEQSKDVKNEK